LLGETAKHHEVDWLHEADKAITSSLEIPYCHDSSSNLILMSVEMKAHLSVRLNILLQGCTTLVCCNGCSDIVLAPWLLCSVLYILVQLCKTHTL